MQSSLTYRQGVLLVLAAGFLWSLMGLFIRLLGDASTWQVLFYRSLGIVPVLFTLISLRSGGRPFAALRAMGVPGLIGGASLVVSFATAISAIQSTTVANAVFLFSVTPLTSALLAWAVLGERVRPATWIAIAIALGGIFLMVREGLSLGAGWGNLSALASAAFFSVFTVVIRRRGTADATPAILIGALMAVSVAAAMIALRGDGFALPPASVGIAMGMGAVILGGGLTIFALGGRVVPAAEMSLLALLEVLLGPVWVWLFLGEETTAATLLGGAVVLAALVFNTAAGGRAREPSHASP